VQIDRTDEDHRHGTRPSTRSSWTGGVIEVRSHGPLAVYPLAVGTRSLVAPSERQVCDRYQSIATIRPSQTPFIARSRPLTAAGAREGNRGANTSQPCSWPMAVARERSPTFCSRS
jgi:hypothetical protein